MQQPVTYIDPLSDCHFSADSASQFYVSEIIIPVKHDDGKWRFRYCREIV